MLAYAIIAYAMLAYASLGMLCQPMLCQPMLVLSLYTVHAGAESLPDLAFARLCSSIAQARLAFFVDLSNYHLAFHKLRLKTFCSSQIKSQLNHEPLLQIARQFMFFSKADFNHTERGQFSISKNYIQVPLVLTMYMYVLLSFNNLRTDNECMDESTMPFTKNQTQPNVLLRCSYFSDIEKYCRKKIFF